MKFTLVSTVFNEISRIADTVEDINKQTRIPDEVIITDAGSNDGTYEFLLNWSKDVSFPVIILQEKKCNVARGRNLAIEAASNDVIVSTDFGCRFHQMWLESLVRPFECDNKVKVVGGAYSVLEDQIKSLASKSNYVLTNGYSLNIENWFIPSSRSIAYLKSVWDDVGGYPEWLTLAGDDLVFGMKLQAKAYKWHVVDLPYVYWLRHEETVGYKMESFRYGLGDGEAGVNFKNSIILVAEQVFRILFVGAAFMTVFSSVWFISAMLLFSIGYRPYFRSIKNWNRLKSEKYNVGILFYAFILLEKTRFCYLKGYIKGIMFCGANTKHERSKLKTFLN